MAEAALPGSPFKRRGKPDVLVNETESSSLQATFFWAPTTHDVGLFPPRHQSINQMTYYPTCILNLVNLKGIFVNKFLLISGNQVALHDETYISDKTPIIKT